MAGSFGNCLYVKLNANCKQGRSTNPGMNINGMRTRTPALALPVSRKKCRQNAKSACWQCVERRATKVEWEARPRRYRLQA
jgi:hypothetical protein